MKVDIKLCRPDLELPLPSRQTPGSAGMDLYAAESCELLPGLIRMVSTGIMVALPPAVCMLILPRSGLASKGITVANTPGLIDSDYRGEIRVLLHNHRSTAYKVNIGDRIAQALIVAHHPIEWCVVDQLSETSRGVGGFGSTG